MALFDQISEMITKGKLGEESVYTPTYSSGIDILDYRNVNGVRACADTREVYAQMLVQCSLDGRNDSEYAYGAGEGLRHCVYAVGAAGDIVSSGGCIVAHGDVYRLVLCLEMTHGVPYLFAGKSAAATGIDA